MCVFPLLATMAVHVPLNKVSHTATVQKDLVESIVKKVSMKIRSYQYP